jgi:predicted aldo/keto reductase-like oxidoreductase
MRYRDLGQLEWRPSALGFGCMRLPVLGNDSGQIDEPEAIAMVRRAIDAGVNYLDTAYGYHRGNSERLVAKALADGYRDRARVATKMPMWLLEQEADLDRIFDEQRSKLDSDHVDFYLLHGLGPERWQNARQLGVLAWAERRMAAGHIGHLGFSFHADLASFRDIIRGYDNWTLCQIQYNYMDIHYQAGADGMREAAARGIGVVVMEPLRGGGLAAAPPPQVKAIWDAAPTYRSPADWALQWLWDQPEVSLVLSGMSTMQQVVENLESAKRSGVGTLADDERALVLRAAEAFRSLAPVGCTLCEYCLPCPHGVEIPSLLEAYNSVHMYPSQLARARGFYGRQEDRNKASACVACGECVGKCPQGLAIPGLLAQVHELLGARGDTGAGG